MKADIRVEGLDGLRSRLGSAAQTLDAQLRPAIRDAANEMKAEARRRAVGNKLPNSVQMRIMPGGLSAIVGSVAKTALSIERGRQRGDMPAVGLITAWMGRRGIAAQVEGARVSVKTRKVLGVSNSAKGQVIGRAQRDLAWKIAMSIRERGTRALPFIIPAASAKKERAQELINAAVGRTLRLVAKG